MPILLLALQSVPPKLSHESFPANEIQRQMNADALQAVFDLILAPLQEIAEDGAVMDCAEGKMRLCFQIFSGGCWARRQLHAGVRYVPVA